MHPGNGYHDLVPFTRCQALPFLWTQPLQRQLLCYGDVVTLDGAEHPDKGGDQQDDDPGPLDELADSDDQQGYAGRHRTQAVDSRLPLPAPPTLFVPMAHHPRLRQGEGEKSTYREQRDKPVSLPIKDDDQARSQESQGDDTVGKDQPVAQVGQLARQVAVAGENGRQPGKVSKSGLGRQHQEEHRYGLQSQIKRSMAKDLPADLRHNGLILNRHHTQRAGQEGDAQEHRRQESSHGDERLACIVRLRLLEGGDAVADGFNAGQGGAARGKGAQNEKQRKGLCAIL